MPTGCRNVDTLWVGCENPATAITRMTTISSAKNRAVIKALTWIFSIASPVTMIIAMAAQRLTENAALRAWR